MRHLYNIRSGSGCFFGSLPSQFIGPVTNGPIVVIQEGPVCVYSYLEFRYSRVDKDNISGKDLVIFEIKCYSLFTCKHIPHTATEIFQTVSCESWQCTHSNAGCSQSCSFEYHTKNFGT